MGRDGEAGYATVAAVAAMGAFAYLAFQVVIADQGAIAAASARAEQAQLAAAADAGLALAIHGLADPDRARRWSIDGRARRLEFNGTELSVSVEDERGKAPLSGLSDDQARALFQGAGAAPERIDGLVAEYRQWVSDGTAEPDSAPPPDRPVRHGPFASIGELSGLADMTPALLARIAPAVTVFPEDSGPFERADATPLALAAMAAEVGNSPETLDNEAQIAAERPVEEIASKQDLVGRALTVRVVARAQDGARTHRMAIVELTGDTAEPYVIRFVE